MGELHYPSAWMIARNGFLGFDFLATFLNMGNIRMSLYDQNGRVTRVSFVGAEVLLSVWWRQDDAAIKNRFKLGDIMPIGPCDD
jgi:hypothetical protein